MEDACPSKVHLHDVCFPVCSAKCEDIKSACAFFKSLDVAEGWMKKAGHYEFMCRTESVRSKFKVDVIESDRCEGHQPNLNHVDSDLKKKCAVLEILNKLKKWLDEYVIKAKPELAHISSNSDIC